MQEKELTLREKIDGPELQSARRHLQNFRDRVDTCLPSEYWQNLSQLKKEAVDTGDQLTAKAVWSLETAGRIQDHFISAFKLIRSEDCEKAWQQLDRCATELIFLDKHLSFDEENDEFGLEYIRVQTKQIQELYLLTWGASPAFIYKKVRCSICGAKITLRSECGHISGEIYDGEMCGSVVEGIEILHIALVENPAQKYSVFFPDGNDNDLLEPVKFLGRHLKTPWQRWSCYKETRRQYHPVFKDVGRNDSCPCGSERKYKRCCFGNEESFPHFQFTFEEGSATALPSLEVHRRRHIRPSDPS